MSQITYVAPDAPDNGNRYILELTDRTRFNLAAALGAFKQLADMQGVEFPDYAQREYQAMKDDIIDAEVFNLNEDAEADADFVELNELERQIVLTALGVLVHSLQSGTVIDDIGITPRAVKTIIGKLLGVEEDA